MAQNWRGVDRLVEAQATSDGAGVNLNRTIATGALSHLDPFLLLDEFNSENPGDYIAGFPDHPHRGFETVTYMIEGRMRHEDNAGNAGTLRSGGVQWMTAGRGIIHSEMPEQEDGKMQGFQLWVNLPASLKMSEPRYQDLDPETVPEIAHDNGALVRVIAGEHDGKRGPVADIVAEPLYLDIALPPGASVTQPIAEGHTGFVYVFEGEAVSVGGPARPSRQPAAAPQGEPPSDILVAAHPEVRAQRASKDAPSSDSTPVPYRTLAILGDGDAVALHNDTGKPARALLIAGKPIGEPIVRYGPFVMNTREEIQQAFNDFKEGRF